MDLAPAFTAVLGDERILAAAAATASRRVVAPGASANAGIAAFGPLYGPAAEGIVAVREPPAFELVCELLERLMEALGGDGRGVVHFALRADQLALAQRVARTVSGARLHERRLSVRASVSGESVTTTDPIAQPPPMEVPLGAPRVRA